METVKFGIIGCGLMGKEFASAAARWCHLTGNLPRPEIVAICDANPATFAWYDANFSIAHHCTDYRELLKLDEVEAVYCAVPHVMHQQVYVDIINAGKHLMGEKPFGMDKAQNDAILAAAKAHPEVFVRCSSQFPFFPACQELIHWLGDGKFGRIIEVRAGFNHASDMDPHKPINWKRKVEINGEYGCLGDLGLHTQHVPFRSGWEIRSVYAMLSDLIKERPDGKGNMVPCDTYENAVLACHAREKNGNEFPLLLETKRVEPGATNEWYLTVKGMKASAKFNSNDPNAFVFLYSEGKEQAWQRIDIGYKSPFPTITGSIFEFGFTDAILQMWASFISELKGLPVSFGCVRPEETALSHQLNTAALESHKQQKVVKLV